MTSARANIVVARGATGRGAHSDSEKLAKGLGWFSIGLGLFELVAARTLCRALGMEGREGLVRAYGVRELATGAAILTSHDPTPFVYGRVAGDALDIATLAAGFGRNNPNNGNLALATAAVVGVTILDALCAQGLTAEQRLARPGTFDYRSRSGFPRSATSARGAASDFKAPADFRIPDALRPWQAAGK